MQEMNPYYARESAVGPVFDVAHAKRANPFEIGRVVALVLAILVAAAVVFVLNPVWFKGVLPESIEELEDAVRDGWRDHPVWMWVGVGVGGCIAYVLASVFVADVISMFQGEFYLRSGPGGLSIRVPNGLASGILPWCEILEIDLNWSDIDRWKVTQNKRLGAISANAGNLDAHLEIWTDDGTKHWVPLDYFREPARLIYDRMQQSIEWVPMAFDSDEQETDHEEVTTY